MSYVYTEQRPELFTEHGTAVLLAIKDNVTRLLGQAGAVRAQEVFAKTPSGDTWLSLAALDYLVEIGAIREVTDGSTWGQYRVFVDATGA